MILNVTGLPSSKTMDPEDKKRGRRLEEQCFQVLRNLLRDALDRDPSCFPGYLERGLYEGTVCGICFPPFDVPAALRR